MLRGPWLIPACIFMVPSALLSGCASESDKAARPLAKALGELGLVDVSYVKAFQDTGNVRLAGVTAGLATGGRVAIEILEASGVAETPDGWSADRIVMTRVSSEGSGPSAGQVIMSRPRRGKAGVGLQYQDMFASAYKGRTLGLSMTADNIIRSQREGDGETNLVFTFDGLRVEPEPGTPPALSTLTASGLKGSVLVRRDRPGYLMVEASDIGSERGMASGEATLSGVTPEALGLLSAMPAAAFLQPSAWPAGVALQAMRVNVAWGLPQGQRLDLPGPGSAVDAGAREILAATAAMADTGKMFLEVEARPTMPVPVSELASAFASADAMRTLGIRARGPGISPILSAGMPQGRPGSGLQPSNGRLTR